MADTPNAGDQEDSSISDDATLINDPMPSTSNSPATPISSTLSLFECPVCFEYILPPIMQCLHGHLVCKNCRDNLTSCPLCRGPLPNIHNLAMDRLAATIQFPCKHANNGCTASLAHTEKLAHDENCEYRHYMCPCPGNLCEWRGRLDAVMEHMQTAHGDISILEGEEVSFTAFGVDIVARIAWGIRQQCFGQQFLVFLEKKKVSDGYFQYCAMMKLIGVKAEAEKYVYRIHLGDRQRFTWQSVPLSLQEDIMPAAENRKCLVFNTPLDEQFKQDGKLQMTVTISIAETPTDPINNVD